MNRKGQLMFMTRRELLRNASLLAGSALVVRSFPTWWTSSVLAQAQTATDPVQAMRVQMGMAPIETTKLGPNLVMLSGPGGNVAVLSGPDGKIVVDSFVQTVWAPLKKTIDSMGGGPIKTLIDTHWHFDHVDNNQNFRQAGAAILAHANTKKRMSETHQLLGMTFTPAPAAALPTETFTSTHKIAANGENLSLAYVPPAHTDTDITVHYAKANVLHMGDLFFNGVYPVIDTGTGGNINGMIAASAAALKMVDNNTKIVPGHGALANKAALQTYHDVLVFSRDAVRKLKTSGRNLKDTIAAKPTAQYDATWGKGFAPPDAFITVIYNGL